jgi:hypothetical protein
MYPGGPVRQPYAGIDFISSVRIYEFDSRARSVFLSSALLNLFQSLIEKSSRFSVLQVDYYRQSRVLEREEKAIVGNLTNEERNFKFKL